MATTKYVYFTLASAANGVDTLVNAGQGIPTLGDDFKDRTLTGIFMVNNNALCQVFIRSKTKKIAQFPLAAFSSASVPLTVKYRYPKTILFDVGFTNASGGAIANLEGYLRYDVDGEEDQLI